MSVHYKFKSSLEFHTVTFDGLHISVGDLKKAILHQNKITKSTDFDLQITNAQTKEVYNDDADLIPKNTSLVVVRIPVSSTQPKKTWERSDTNQLASVMAKSAESNPDGLQDLGLNKLAQTVDLSSMDASEEDKIKAMMTQSTLDYDPVHYVKFKGGNQVGEVPANYRCYKCFQTGHWIRNCPLGQDPIDIKKSTGIPRSFMVPVDGPLVPGAMMTPTGHYAVPAIDHEAYKEQKKEKPPFQQEPPVKEEKPEIPEDLVCDVCKDLLTDAVMVPCCGNSYCDECIRTVLLESEDHECPDCKEKNVSPDTLIPNRFLRNAVLKFKNETGYRKPKAFVPLVKPVVQKQSIPVVQGHSIPVIQRHSVPMHQKYPTVQKPSLPVVQKEAAVTKKDPYSEFQEALAAVIQKDPVSAPMKEQKDPVSAPMKEQKDPVSAPMKEPICEVKKVELKVEPVPVESEPAQKEQPATEKVQSTPPEQKTGDNKTKEEPSSVTESQASLPIGSPKKQDAESKTESQSSETSVVQAETASETPLQSSQSSLPSDASEGQEEEKGSKPKAVEKVRKASTDEVEKLHPPGVEEDVEITTVLVPPLLKTRERKATKGASDITTTTSTIPVLGAAKVLSTNVHSHYSVPQVTSHAAYNVSSKVQDPSIAPMHDIAAISHGVTTVYPTSHTAEERPGTPTVDEQNTDIPQLPDIHVPPPQLGEDLSTYHSGQRSEGVQQIQTIDSLRSKRGQQALYGSRGPGDRINDHHYSSHHGHRNIPLRDQMGHDQRDHSQRGGSWYDRPPMYHQDRHMGQPLRGGNQYRGHHRGGRNRMMHGSSYRGHMVGRQPPPPGMSGSGIHNGDSGGDIDPLEAFQRMLKEKSEREAHRHRSRRSRSYSRSPSRSTARSARSFTPSRSRSRSRSVTRSRTRSRTRTRTRSKTRSRSRTRSRSFTLSRSPTPRKQSPQEISPRRNPPPGPPPRYAGSRTPPRYERNYKDTRQEFEPPQYYDMENQYTGGRRRYNQRKEFGKEYYGENYRYADRYAGRETEPQPTTTRSTRYENNYRRYDQYEAHTSTPREYPEYREKEYEKPAYDKAEYQDHRHDTHSKDYDRGRDYYENDQHEKASSYSYSSPPRKKQSVSPQRNRDRYSSSERHDYSSKDDRRRKKRKGYEKEARRSEPPEPEPPVSSSSASRRERERDRERDRERERERERVVIRKESSDEEKGKDRRSREKKLREAKTKEMKKKKKEKRKLSAEDTERSEVGESENEKMRKKKKKEKREEKVHRKEDEQIEVANSVKNKAPASKSTVDVSKSHKPIPAHTTEKIVKQAAEPIVKRSITIKPITNRNLIEVPKRESNLIEVKYVEDTQFEDKPPASSENAAMPIPVTVGNRGGKSNDRGGKSNERFIPSCNKVLPRMAAEKAKNDKEPEPVKASEINKEKPKVEKEEKEDRKVVAPAEEKPVAPAEEKVSAPSDMKELNMAEEKGKTPETTEGLEEGEVQDAEDEPPEKVTKSGAKESSVMTAPLPEISRWERDDYHMQPVRMDNSSSGDKSDKSNKVVTTEVLKRAENAIFQKAITGIRPIEAKKVERKVYCPEKEELPREKRREEKKIESVLEKRVIERKVEKENKPEKVEREARTAGNSLQITIPTGRSERSIEIAHESRGAKVKIDRGRFAPPPAETFENAPPPRLPAKERLGIRVNIDVEPTARRRERESRHTRRGLKSAVEKKTSISKSRSRSPIHSTIRRYSRERERVRSISQERSKERVRHRSKEKEKEKVKEKDKEIEKEKEKPKHKSKELKKKKEEKKKIKHKRSRSSERESKRKKKEKKHRKEKIKKRKQDAKRKKATKRKESQKDGESKDEGKDPEKNENVGQPEAETKGSAAAEGAAGQEQDAGDPASKKSKKERKNPRLATDRKRSTLDEAQFEPDYDASSGSESESEEDPEDGGDAKKNESGAAQQKKEDASASTEANAGEKKEQKSANQKEDSPKKKSRKKRPRSISLSSSESSDSSEEEEEDDDDEEESSSEESDSESESSHSTRRKKKRKSRKKKKSRHVSSSSESETESSSESEEERRSKKKHRRKGGKTKKKKKSKHR